MHASTLPDIIAATPVMLGYVPEERVVMIVAKANNLFGALAMDIPCTGDEAVESTLKMIQQAEAVSAERVFMLIFTQREEEEGIELNMGLLALAFSTTALARGLEVEGMASVTSKHWRDYGDPDKTHPLSDIQDSPLAAAMVAAGHNLEPVADTVPEPDLASMTLTLKALNFRATLPRMDHLDLSDRDTRMLRDAWDLWCGVVDTDGDMSEREAADLIGYFQHSLFRDLFITRLVRTTFDIQDMGAVLRGMIEDPQVEYLVGAKKISTTLKELLRWTERDQRPNLLAVLGFTEWFMGHGTYAHACFNQIKSIDITHRLGMLLATVAAKKGLSPAITMPGAEPYMKIVNGHG